MRSRGGRHGSESYGTEIEIGWQPFSALRFVTSHASLEIKDDPADTALTLAGNDDDKSPRHTWILRGAWQATDWLAIELVGQNLTSTYHVEYGDPTSDPSTYIPGSYYGKVTFTFQSSVESPVESELRTGNTSISAGRPPVFYLCSRSPINRRKTAWPSFSRARA